MSVIAWNLVFDTHTESTALKLVGRVRRRLQVEMEDVWLRPWGEGGDRYAATFVTGCPESESVAGSALSLAGRLAAIWTIVLDQENGRSEGVLLEAWMPRDYRRSMEGLVEASLTVLNGTPTGAPSESTRRRMAGDVVVNVVSRKTERSIREPSPESRRSPERRRSDD